MGNGDGDVHFLRAPDLAGVTALYVVFDLLSHIWPEISEGDVLFHCPCSMVSCCFVHFLQNFLPSLFWEDHYLGRMSWLMSIHVGLFEMEWSGFVLEPSLFSCCSEFGHGVGY
jgi:hypothetical protein